MPELQANPSSRGAELAVLVDLEARWENLRASRTSASPSSLQELQSYQRAYDLFHTKLVAYNNRYTPRHIPEVLINTSVRLEQWCKKLSTLFATLDDQVPFPAHLLAKAYRLADVIVRRSKRACAGRPAPGEVPSAARQLEMLAAWCSEPPALDAAA